MIAPAEQRISVFCLRDATIARIVQYDVLLNEALIGKTGKVYLVSQSRIWPGGAEAVFHDDAASRQELPGNGVYVNHMNVPVIGAYYHLDESGIGFVEQAGPEFSESADRIAAADRHGAGCGPDDDDYFSGGYPADHASVIQLTESAVAMAEGDLAQRRVLAR